MWKNSILFYVELLLRQISDIFLLLKFLLFSDSEAEILIKLIKRQFEMMNFVYRKTSEAALVRKWIIL